MMMLRNMTSRAMTSRMKWATIWIITMMIAEAGGNFEIPRPPDIPGTDNSFKAPQQRANPGTDRSLEAPAQHGTNPGTERSEGDFVQLTKTPPFLQTRKKVTVSYHCDSDSVVVLDVVVMVFGSEEFKVACSKAWKCRGQRKQGKPRTKSFRLHLPPSLGSRPGILNSHSHVIVAAKLKVAMVTTDAYSDSRTLGQTLRSNHKDFKEIPSLPPYSRPALSLPCLIWYWPMLQRYRPFKHTQSCPKEPEKITLLDYPSVFNGGTYGILRTLPKYQDAVLEGKRIQMYRRPKMSIEVWFYVLDYCPKHHLNPGHLCGIVVHHMPFNVFRSPVILINVQGQIQIEIEDPTGVKSIKTMDIVPKNTWIRLLFSLDLRTWHVYISHGTGLKQGFIATFTYDEDVHCDDTEGYFSIGGLGDTLGSFVGYIGRVVVYRGRTLVPKQLTPPGPFHPMYELGLTGRDKRCQRFLSWLDSTIGIYTQHYQYRQGYRTDQCPNTGRLAFDISTTCPISHRARERQYRHLSKLLKKAVATQSLTPHKKEGGASVMEAYGKGGGSRYSDRGQQAIFNVSRGLMDKAMGVLSRRGLRKSGRMVSLLKQSACLGNDDAMFHLAAMLNNGVGVASDEMQSLAFFMLGTLNGHPLSSMALAYRHSVGIDGTPHDLDIAYMYYKTVADKCRRDRDEHKDSGYLPEKIRLIDEWVLDVQTSEAGDLFMWLKDQAAKGVTSAKDDIAHLLYWGKQGIQRNLQNALNVYREQAQEGNVNSMYNYGIMQYRGIGGKANKTEGKQMMKRAAEKRSPDAVNALGWLALEVDKNYTEAESLFRQAKLIGHMDAGYFLGHMHIYGYMPNATTVDYDKALKEFEWSAIRQQIHAGTLYSFLLSRGTPKYPRNLYNAVSWARHVAEQNADLGTPLRSAVDAFRYGKLDESLYQYLVLAETGLEVATFNLAYLCELNTEGVTSYISKECQWRNYNLTVQREFQFVDPYSYIKMGDYYWYGCQKTRDVKKAARFYGYAIAKGDPQALFNLAYMVEEGVVIPADVWVTIRIVNKEILNSTYSILTDLYTRCRESRKSEAFVPCTLALARIQVLDVWSRWCQYFQVSSLLGAMAAMFVSAFILYQWLVLRIRRVGLTGRGRRRWQSEEEEEAVEDTEEVAVEGGDVQSDGATPTSGV